jgi:hypothetical protein
MDNNIVAGVGATSSTVTFNVASTTANGSSIIFNVATSSAANLFSVLANGNVGIGTTTAAQKLSVVGNFALTGALFDGANASGTLGMVLQSTGTSTQWVATSSLGITGGAALTGGMFGYVSRWLSATTLGTSTFIDNGLVTGINATSSSYVFNVQATSTSNNNPFNVASSTGTSLFTILANGNIGVGSSTPGSNFSVTGTAGDLDNLFTVASSSGQQWLNVASNGRIGIGSSTPGASLSVTGKAGLNALVVASSTGSPLLTLDQTGSVLLGTSTAFSTGKIQIDTNLTATGSANAIAGIYGNYVFNTAATGTQVGNRYTILNAPTNASNTSVGEIIRTTDNTTLDNTVRGIEVVSSVGSNTSGINTGIRTTGATFGLEAYTTGLAGGISAPAAVYAQNNGTTTGTALRLYSSTVTSAESMAKIYQESSAFSGTGLYMDLGANGGSFTGNFLDLRKNAVSQLTISNAGNLTTNGNIFATGTLTVIGNTTLGNASSSNFTTSGSFYVGTSTRPIFFADVANNRINIGTSTGSSLVNIQGTTTVNILSISSSTGASLFNFGSNGRLGIGTSTPAGKLSITATAGQPAFVVASSSGATVFTIDAGGNVGIGTTTLSASSSVLLTVAGNIRVGTSTALGGCIESFGGGTLAGTCTSDQNLKTNILDITDVLPKLASLRVVNFNWNTLASNLYGKNTGINNTGYIAQNVESLFPELVVTNGQGYKEVNYAGMNLYAIEGVKELSIATTQASSTLSLLGASTANNFLQASTTIAALATTVNANYVEASTTFATTLNLINSNNTNLQSQIDSITSKINVTSAATSSLTISSLGVVGIGNDATQLGDELLRVSGRVRATGFDIDAAADLAENFEAVEAVDAGTVVAFSTTTAQWTVGKATATSTNDEYTMSTVRKARASYEAVGVIYTNPGIVLGKRVQNGVPVAFSGRIPVKVTTEAGEVKQGDYLTVSDTMPGYAMKLVGEGQSIGRAVSDYVVGREKVLMIVENGLQKLDLSGKHATTTGMLTTGNIDLNANGVAITNIKSLASANGTWSIDENGLIVAKQLCLEDLCIDKTTLTNLLNISGQSGTVLGASTSTNSTSTSTNSTSTDPGTGTNSTSTPNGAGTSTPPVVSGADTTAPVVTITGQTSVSLSVGGTYTDEGATANDNVDGDLTSAIIVTGTVDTATVGTYGVNYTATDAAGNTTTVTRVVDVATANP